MSIYRIAVVAGSIRRESLNRKLAAALVRLVPADFSFHDPRIDDLPLYNQDDEKLPAASELRLQREIADADGFMFVTPDTTARSQECSRTPSITARVHAMTSPRNSGRELAW
jgi:chromate reductase